MDLRTLVKEIEQGHPAPVCVCYGIEAFRMQEFVTFLIHKTVPTEEREFAVSRYDLTETPLAEVIQDAGTPPFLAERKVVIASQALFLTGAKDPGKVEHRVELLLDYLKSPAEFTVLILTVPQEKLDERKKIVKTLKERGCTLPFAPLRADELLQWVVRRAASLHVTFDRDAAETVLMRAGTNLQTLATELEKLSLFVGKGGTITNETVDRMVARTTEQDVFQLIDDMVRLRKEQALSILYELIRQREEPVKIAMLMARQFRIMLQAKELERQGYSQQQIASHVGAHPYAVKIAAEQARRFDVKQLGELLARLSELDYQMKSGRVDKVLGLELFILQLAV